MGIQGKPDFSGLSVLIMEDDLMLADDASEAIARTGANVLGPFADEASAMRCVRETLPDCAILDVNLGQGPTYQLARLLRALDVPFSFMTGYDANLLPDEFRGVHCLQKPVQVRHIVHAVVRMI